MVSIQNALNFLNKKYLVFFLAILVNIVFTLLNKYPILYSDSSTYISSGFELEAPFDRPITYGILLRLFSLNGLSFVFVSIMQSLIFIYLLYSVLGIFFDRKKTQLYLLLLTIVLSVFTGFNWSINQLLPDFLTSVGFLSLICIFFRSRAIKKEAFMFFLFFISAASHISNEFIYLLMLIAFWLLKNEFNTKLNLKAFKIKLSISFLLLVISYIVMTSAISKSKHVFFTGSLAQKGILQEILKDKCNDHTFKLCYYKDSIPKSFEYFVWNEKSPLYKIGGWKESKKEFNYIINTSLTEPKYIEMQIDKTALNFFDQLITFDIGEGNGAFDENTLLIQRIKKYTVLDDDLCVSTQQRAEVFLKLDAINLYYRITTGISFLLLVVLFFYNYKKLNSRLKSLVYLTISLIILSSFLVAFSSEVSNRHGVKLIWLITVLNFLIIADLISNKKNSPPNFHLN